MEPSALAVELAQSGVIAVTGADARSFLHAQLTNDIAQQPAGRARRAGWCSAKGRLLATFLVVPHGDGFLLQLARDLVPGVLKRLQMFVLRARVVLADAGAAWTQYGLSGASAARALEAFGVAPPADDLEVTASVDLIVTRLAAERYLVFAGGAQRGRLATEWPRGEAVDWALEDIRAGVPQIVAATQDLFVPQMVNLQLLDGVDFHKGCYPGQEIVARAQYRGQLKRCMARLRSPVALRPGQDLYSDDLPGQPSGTVVNAANGEALAVLQIATLESGTPVRAEPGGAPLERLPLPQAA
jgi:folate-binding protein YgfZ